MRAPRSPRRPACAASPCGTRTRPRHRKAPGRGCSPRATAAARRETFAPAATGSGPRGGGCYMTVVRSMPGHSGGCRCGARRLAALEHLEQRVNHARVELRASVQLQLAAGGLAAHRLAVRPVARHRLVRVADEDDPGAEGD